MTIATKPRMRPSQLMRGHWFCWSEGDNEIACLSRTMQGAYEGWLKASKMK